MYDYGVRIRIGKIHAFHCGRMHHPTSTRPVPEHLLAPWPGACDFFPFPLLDPPTLRVKCPGRCLLSANAGVGGGKHERHRVCSSRNAAGLAHDPRQNAGRADTGRWTEGDPYKWSHAACVCGRTAVCSQWERASRDRRCARPHATSDMSPFALFALSPVSPPIILSGWTQ